MPDSEHRRLALKPPGWKFDLPGPNEPPNQEPRPGLISNPPNSQNNLFMELPRSTLKVRGLLFWGAIIFLPLSLTAPALWIAHVVWTGKFPDIIFHLGILTILITSIWGGIYFWKMDMQAPLDEPIRFNRARRKIYVYRFRSNGLKLFDRNEWGVSVETYDWDNLRAEFCSIYGPMGTGGLIETINLAVEDPHTHEVLQRFHFAHGGQQGQMYWALAQLFMQQGPHALPTFERPPRDWNNEVHTFNLARRFAPKVQWPADIDLESRTVPSPPEQLAALKETTS
jgi:hypothetical protein